MYVCIICRFEVTLDDVAFKRPFDRCICLTCYTRETQTARPMPPAVRRDAQQSADTAG